MPAGARGHGARCHYCCQPPAGHRSEVAPAHARVRACSQLLPTEPGGSGWALRWGCARRAHLPCRRAPDEVPPPGVPCRAAQHSWSHAKPRTRTVPVPPRPILRLSELSETLGSRGTRIEQERERCAVRSGSCCRMPRWRQSASVLRKGVAGSRLCTAPSTAQKRQADRLSADARRAAAGAHLGGNALERHQPGGARRRLCPRNAVMHAAGLANQHAQAAPAFHGA